jgi:heptaprenylglyceryl phosphate synthase
MTVFKIRNIVTSKSISDKILTIKLPNKVFVDTSFFIALMNSRDTYHSQAVKLQEQLSKQPVQKITSDYILLELCDGLAKLNWRHFVFSFCGYFKSSSNF